MKRYIVLATLALSFFVLSCEKENDNIHTVDPGIRKSSVVAEGVSRQISSEEAELLAQVYYDAVQKGGIPGSRASVPLMPLPSKPSTVSSVVPLSKGSVPLLYIVNFGSSDGYMVLPADRAAGLRMYAFAERGHISSQDDLTEGHPFAIWLNEELDRIEGEMSQEKEIPQDIIEFWDALNKASTTDYSVSIELVGEDDSDGADDSNLPNDADPDARTRAVRGAHHKGSWGLRTVGVYEFIRQSAWGQGAGYNVDAKIKHARAGCSAIAIGVYCTTLRTPSLFDYDMMPFYLAKTQISTPLSRMLRTIADRIPNYSWGIQGSSATLPNIRTGLRNLGFERADYASYTFDRAYSQIRYDYPVLLTGFSSDSGHIWIADGYWEQRWRVRIKFLWWTLKSWTEYSDMIYMNFGWYGFLDGWINQGVWGDYNLSRKIFYNMESY
ncbi:MAG: hypothetical protein CSA97_05715 [Bacteroidetes bacterium]|nr:MAG: hypothetical protein CSA97_05715 [Bacteroidota bacterium]